MLLPAVPYPARWERAAAAVYRKAMREITAGILAALTPILDESRTDGTRTDAAAAVSPKQLAAMRRALTALRTKSLTGAPSRLIKAFKRIAEGVFTNVEEKTNAGLKTVAAVNIVSESAPPAMIEAWATKNAGLIRKLQPEAISDMQRMVFRGVADGTTTSDLSKQIKARFGVDDRKADFWARDQVSKLNGNITAAKQKSLGVEEYVWVTSGDERVRPTHRANNGKRFRWDTPPPVTGHPGHDYNDRCTARAVLPGDTAESLQAEADARAKAQAIREARAAPILAAAKAGGSSKNASQATPAQIANIKKLGTSTAASRARAAEGPVSVGEKPG